MARTELVFEPNNPPSPDGIASGLVDLCGQMGLAFAAQISDFAPDAESHPILACCPDADIALLCGNDGGMRGWGRLENGTCPICTTSLKTAAYSTTDLTCTTSATSLSTLIGYDLTGGYWIGDLPFTDSAGDWTGWKTILYCDGGTMKCRVIDDNNCPQWVGTLVSADCVNLAWRFSFGEPAIFCCDESIGDAYIDWSP